MPSVESGERYTRTMDGRAAGDLPIGIFDSGLGGLTVMGEVVRSLPHERIHYFGDTGRMPYGPKPLEDVRSFVLQIGAWFTQRPVKLLVIACNTGTVAGLEAAQRAFDVPVIGVVEPGARAAVMATVNRRIGVIGTKGTIESGAYSEAVRALDAGVTVFSRATPKFVDIVESGLRKGPGSLEDWLAASSDVFVRPAFYEVARDYLVDIKRAGVDVLVLGCTHFPLLAPAIQQVAGPRIQLISSAQETAREVREALSARGQVRQSGDAPEHSFATTGDPEEFQVLGGRVLRTPIRAVTRVPVSDLEALAREPLVGGPGP